MEDQDALQPQQEVPQAVPHYEALESNPDACLLLVEVLLEEYDSLEQPPLDPDALAKIRGDCQKFKKYIRSKHFQNLNEAEQESELRSNNGALAQAIYGLMSKTQKETVQKIEDKYRQLYRHFPEGDRQESIDRAVLLEITGDIQEIRAKKRELAQKELDEGAGELDQQLLESNTEQKLIQQIHHDAIARPAEVDKAAKGNGNKEQRRSLPDLKDTKTLHAQSQRSALCLSGGGIRSATFNLGILQGLARHGILSRVDYLSTVSGGGFIGGWLSAWIHRSGLDEVVDKLSKPPKSTLEPDPGPVEHLRIYSNYLSPQPGLLSADTWTLIASLLRNILLNWFVFVPVLIALLILPRLWAAILLRSTLYEKYSVPISLTIGIIGTMWAFSYIGLHLPSAVPDAAKTHAKRLKTTQGEFIRSCLIPLLAGALGFSVFFWERLRFPKPPLGLFYYVGIVEAFIIVPWVLCAIKVKSTIGREKGSKSLRSKLIWATVLILLAQFITGYVLRYVTQSFLPGPTPKPNQALYATFSVPILLMVVSFGGALIAGFTSQLTNDDDQEWWARAGAWMFISIIAWSLLNLVVFYGPSMFLTLGTTFQRWRMVGLWNLPWEDFGKLFGIVAGVISGIITLFGGVSVRTPANEKEARTAGMGGKILSLLTSLVAPIFLVFILVLIALGTNWLLTSSLIQNLNYLLVGKYLPAPYEHLRLLSESPFRLLLLLLLLVLLFAVVMGRVVNTNTFSLHFMWRNRIIRAYLGASRWIRSPNPFTGFDTYDNLQMYELRKQPAHVHAPGPRKGRPEYDLPDTAPSSKLLHVLNLALNLTGGEKLQWQDRKAESFSVSPLHAGSYWLGYRRSFRYGGPEGISLGTAVAISGAFVSPNMGYMMSSPIIRFLMTLFNVRFGWWLGNPGPVGDKTDIYERLVNLLPDPLGIKPERPFNLRSPRLSIIPVVNEAFGNTDDKSPYVYLSDGGHFENLGLYEMVLRRCRFIIVSDASTDPDYAFQSLAMSVRQIRIDLGVPIDLPEWAITSPSSDMKGKYCAVGKIRYSCVDRNPGDPQTSDEDFDGILIYIKPSLIGDEPRDILNYAQGSSGFPQEVIVDQWFSESQFESYRALGSHIIDAICEGSTNQVNLVTFAQRARAHNQINFLTFKEKIYYTAFEQQFKEAMETDEHKDKLDSFKAKVIGYMEGLLK